MTDHPIYPSDFRERLWKALEARLMADLARARADLESQAMDDQTIAAVRLRARIAVLKTYLRLPEDAAKAAQQADRQAMTIGYDIPE